MIIYFYFFILLQFRLQTPSERRGCQRPVGIYRENIPGKIIHYIYEYIYIYTVFQEYGKPVYSYSTNPDRRFSSSTSQHFKMSPPFASSEGVSASGDRLQSDGVQDTHLLPHS